MHRGEIIKVIDGRDDASLAPDAIYRPSLSLSRSRSLDLRPAAVTFHRRAGSRRLASLATLRSRRGSCQMIDRRDPARKPLRTRRIVSPPCVSLGRPAFPRSLIILGNAPNLRQNSNYCVLLCDECRVIRDFWPTTSDTARKYAYSLNVNVSIALRRSESSTK